MAGGGGGGLSIGLRVISVGLRPGPLENHPVRVNPLGLPLPRSWFHIVDSASFPLLLVAIVGSLAALAARYRRASADERDQLRWLLIAVGLLVVSFALVGNSTVAATGNLLALVAIPLLPLSVGVAVLRQRLDSVDVTVRRSLVYGWLLAAGLAVYAGVVLVLDAVLRGHAAPVVTLVAAGAVAVLYQPLRLRLQRAVDRMLYGDRGDPYAVLTRLGRRLQAAGSAEQTLPETVETIAAALRLPYVAVELLGDPPAQPTAAYGTATDPEPVVIPLTHGGDAVGRLVVGRRDTRDDLTPAECRLLGDLGSQVAVAAHAVLLDRASDGPGNGWWSAGRRSAGGCAATCTTGSARRWPAWRWASTPRATCCEATRAPPTRCSPTSSTRRWAAWARYAASSRTSARPRSTSWACSRR